MALGKVVCDVEVWTPMRQARFELAISVRST